MWNNRIAETTCYIVTECPTDEALMKSVYLSLKEATKKWTGRISGWGEIYSQLSIYFEGRI